MPATVKLIDTRRLPSPDADRLGKFDVLIIYETAAGQRGFVRVPVEDLTDEAIAVAVKADLAERAAWAGREISLGE